MVMYLGSDEDTVWPQNLAGIIKVPARCRVNVALHLIATSDHGINKQALG